jgi:sugar lactone lactonase YvrE
MWSRWASVLLSTIVVAALSISAPAVAAGMGATGGCRLDAVTARSPFHGIHGLTVTGDGQILAGSVVGRTIYEINPVTGAVAVFEPPPFGMADDLDIGPTGTLAWTAPNDGKLFVKEPGGEVRTAAEGLPGLNSVAWTPDGRLFAAQVFQGDALYEFDPAGDHPPRLIRKDLGGLNGFDFGPDGKLYGPLFSRGEIVRIDVDLATMDVLASGLRSPGAVKFSPGGRLFAVDTATGEVLRVDPATGATRQIVRLKPAIDNLAFDRGGRLFVTNMADNAILEVNVHSGKVRTVVAGPLAIAADLDLVRERGQDVLYVSDGFALRKVHTGNGRVTDVARMYGDELAFPTGVTASREEVIVAGWTEGVVQLFDPRTGRSSGLHGGFVTPMDALRLPDGDLAVSDYANGQLLRVDTRTWAGPTVIASGLAGPSMMVLGRDGAVLVSEELGGRISRVEVGSGTVTPVASELDRPEGLALAPGGDLVVAEVGRQRIVRLDLETGQRSVLRRGLPIGLEGLPQAPRIYIPTGVAVALNGDVYVSSDIDAAVYRLRHCLA